jgi:hypothetical protein
MLGRDKRTLPGKIAGEFASHHVNCLCINTIREPGYAASIRQESSHTVERDTEFEADEIVEQWHMPFDMGLPE